MSEIVQSLNIETHSSGRRGDIGVIEHPPFHIKRVFYIYNVPVGEIRGGHAHKNCKQILIAVCGAVRIICGGGQQYILDHPDVGLYIPPGHLIHIDFLVENTTLLVLASEKYSREDYLYGEE